MPVPVHIVSGFLGAGKTTAIRAQLESRSGERMAIIVNDFGEAQIDATRLSESEPYRITNIAGACVCCTAPEGFVDALGAVLEGEPERLWIEPTGLARPQDLVDTMRRCPHRDRLALGPVVVLLDPRRVGAAEDEERAVVDEQLEAADLVVVNRTDLCEPADLERLDERLASLWPAPRVHRTRYGRIPPELFEWPEGEAPAQSAGAPGRHAGHGDSTHGFQGRSWVWPPERVFDRGRLDAALLRLAGGEAGAELARLKGVFRTREGVVRLEVAAGVRDEARSAHRADSRVDVILRAGDAGGLERAGRWLGEALLDEAELQASAEQIELVLPDGATRVLDRDALCALPDGLDDVSQLFPKRAGSAARLRGLLGELGVGEGGTAIVCAADGFVSEPVQLGALREGLLLHSLDAAPLPETKGGPFRLLIPEGTPGAPSSCANVKAVTRIVVRDA